MRDQTVPAEARLPSRRSGANRRAAVRWRTPPATPGRVLLPDPSEDLLGWVVDLSATGLGLLLPYSLDAGTSLHVDVSSHTQAGSVALAARVIHSTPQSGGEWVVGCAFDTPLTEEELDALL